MVLLIAGVMCSLVPSLRADQVAYIEASGGSIAYLSGYGHTVTDLGDPGSLTLADLAGYNAVVVASNSIFSNPTTIGNVVAEFAADGGGVVLTEFDFQGQWALSGNIMTHGYSPFTVDPLSSGYFFSSGLGTINDPSSPLLSGVNTADVSTGYQANVGLDPGATLVASWSSGRYAFAFNSLASSSVVDLNLFPAEGYVTSDDELLLSNAIYFSESGHGSTTIPEPASMVLLGTASLVLLRALRRKQAV